MPVRSEGTYQVPCYLWYQRNDFNDNYTRWCRSAKFIWWVTNDYTNRGEYLTNCMVCNQSVMHFLKVLLFSHGMQCAPLCTICFVWMIVELFIMWRKAGQGGVCGLSVIFTHPCFLWAFLFFIFFSFYLILYRSEKMFKFMIVRSMVGIRCKLLKRKWRRKNQQRVIELVIEEKKFHSLNNMFQFFCFFGGLKHFKVFGGKQLFYLQTYSSLYRYFLYFVF